MSPEKLEFLPESEEGVIPVEVKAKNSRSRSLDNALEQKEIPYGYKLIDGNIGRAKKKNRPRVTQKDRLRCTPVAHLLHISGDWVII